jgi:hypothetical protein
MLGARGYSRVEPSREATVTDEQETEEKRTRGEPQERMEDQGVEPNTEDPDAEGGADTGQDKDSDDMSASEKAQESEKEREQAKETMEKLEQEGAPDDLSEWPDDAAKYETFGGPEGTHPYHEGPEEEQLGPSSLRHREDGTVEIAGEEVDNPDDYKGDPIPGGPTDPNAPDAPGEDTEKDDDSDDGPQASEDDDSGDTEASDDDSDDDESGNEDES